MKVNMLEAKSQLSRLVKEALSGKDVMIASNGEPLVRLVPVTRRTGMRGWGTLKRHSRAIDAAFTPEVEAEVARALHPPRQRRARVGDRRPSSVSW